MEKILRSLIQEKFPLEVRLKIELLSRRRDLVNKEKQEELIKILQSNNISGVVPLGPGTNRYAFKLDGFVIKVATDHDGKIDNMKEFKMAKRLYPYVTKTYEVSENGTILVAEYIQPFESYTEMCRYADKIREILTKLSAVYLIGDVGITNKNYSNWGLRVGTSDPVCLDFAYVYEVSSELFICRHCNANAMLVPNRDFTELYCSNPACGKRYLFEDIRARIGNDIHAHEIGDLSEEGYALQSSYVLTQLDENRSNYLIRKKEEPKKEKHKEKIDLPIEYDNFIMEDPQKMEETKMEIKTITIATPTPGIELKGKVIKATALTPNNHNNLPNNMADPDNSPKLAFSCKVEEENELIEDAVAPIAPFPTVVTKSIPNEVDDKQDVTDEFESEKNYETINVSKNKPDSIPAFRTFSHSFVKNINNAFSKISNKIGNSLHEVALYDKISSHIKAKMYPEQFYKNVQNAVFRSLVAYCYFTENEVPNQNGHGTHKEFKAPSDLYNSEYYDCLAFIEQFWILRSINDMESLSDIRAEYESKSVEPWGLPTYWLASFKRRLGQKMPTMDLAGIMLVCNEIEKLWCSNTEDEDVVEEDENDKIAKIINLINDYGVSEFDHPIITNDTDISDVKLGETEAWENDSTSRFMIEMSIDIPSYRMNWNVCDNTGVKPDFGIYEYKAATADEIISIFNNVSFESLLSMGLDDGRLDILDKYIEDVIKPELSADESQEYTIDDDVTNAPQLAFSTQVDDFSDKMNSPEYPSSEEDNESNAESDEEDDEVEYISVEIALDEEFDIVRINSSDAYGPVSIPLYCHLFNNDEVDISNPIPSIVDDRNGKWDWLIHMVPDMMFKTTNPEYWMRVNDETPEDDQVKVVILSSNKISEDTIEYIMGMYYISNITIIDEEGSRLPGYDEELLIRLNQVINENISLGMISHLKRSLSMKELINTEEFIKNNLADVLLNDDESAIEDNNDSDNVEYESVGNDAEDAAVAALMNSSSNSINVPEEDNTLESELINGKDYSEDEEVETSEEEVVINDNNENVEDVPDNSDYHEYDNEDDNQMMFQPIRRKKRLE